MKRRCCGEVADTYHATLKQSPEAQAYLTQRGLVHGELIDTFRLGYANKSLTYRLPPGYRRKAVTCARSCNAWACIARAATST